MMKSSGSVRPFRPPQRPARGATPSGRPWRDRRRRLRWSGYAALLTGALGAGVIYWNHVHYATPTLEELLPASARAHRRQMGILYGTVGAIAVDLQEAMRRPDTQAFLVLAASAAVAAVCFLAARSSEEDED
jgi:hypothetical protein